MAEITAITPQKRDKTRCNVEVDGRFFCGMKLVTVMQHRLKVGTEVTAEQLASIQLESEKETALDKALFHITATMKTEREMREYLGKQGYLEDVQSYVVGKMKEYGFLDDAAYARAYTESMAKKKGTRLIALELKQKGISEEAIEEAVNAVSDEDETAKRTLEKYLRGKDVTDRKVLQRAFQNLISKGFDYETARRALEGLKNDEDQDP